MIVILDTNIWISGILWSGPPNEIIRLAEKGKISIATSQTLLEELFGVLDRDKFQSQLLSSHTNINAVRESIISLVTIFAPDQKVFMVVADPDDNIVLECALASEADYIISGDDHLLSLKKFNTIPIVTPRTFLTQSQRT
jgi:uncharacterized protein